MEKTRVVVVDPQNGFATEETTPVFNKIAMFISATRSWNRTIVHTFSNDDESPFRKNLPWWERMRKSRETKIIPSFLHHDAKIFRRHTYGFGDDFWLHLEEEGVEQMLLCGVEADATILHSAMESFDKGVPTIVCDCLVGSLYGDTGVHVGLSVLQKVLGRSKIISYQDAVTMMEDTRVYG